jgi:glycosyltransferase involved in cell wall biosynthesis
VPEYVRDGYNGFLIEKGNSAELLDCIERFCHLSSAQRQNLSVNAASTALEYSRKKVVKDLLRYLESCFENA